MASIYAKGKYAIGECRRCGFIYKLSMLRPDGENKLLVCKDCYDIRHPAKKPINTSDATALRNPATELNLEEGRTLTDDRPLGEVLGFDTYFGEHTP